MADNDNQTQASSNQNEGSSGGRSKVFIVIGAIILIAVFIFFMGWISFGSGSSENQGKVMDSKPKEELKSSGKSEGKEEKDSSSLRGNTKVNDSSLVNN